MNQNTLGWDCSDAKGSRGDSLGLIRKKPQLKCRPGNTTEYGQLPHTLASEYTYKPNVRPILIELVRGPMRVMGQCKCIPQCLSVGVSIALECDPVTKTHRSLPRATRNTARQKPRMKMCQVVIQKSLPR